LKGVYDLLHATSPRKESGKLIVETIGYNQTSYNVMKMELGTLWMLIFHTHYPFSSSNTIFYFNFSIFCNE